MQRLEKLPVPFPENKYALIIRERPYPRKLALSKALAIDVLTGLNLTDVPREKLEKKWDWFMIRAYLTLDRFWDDFGLNIVLNFRDGGNSSLFKAPRKMAEIYLQKLLRNDLKRLYNVRLKSYYAVMDVENMSVRLIFPYHDEYIKKMMKRRRWLE